MNSSALVCLTAAAPLPRAISTLEARLETLRMELVTLESHLHQTRGKYWEVMQQLDAVKDQLLSQPVTLVETLISHEEIDLEKYIDADLEHLLTQINNL